MAELFRLVILVIMNNNDNNIVIVIVIYPDVTSKMSHCRVLVWLMVKSWFPPWFCPFLFPETQWGQWVQTLINCSVKSSPFTLITQLTTHPSFEQSWSRPFGFQTSSRIDSSIHHSSQKSPSNPTKLIPSPAIPSHPQPQPYVPAAARSIAASVAIRVGMDAEKGECATERRGLLASRDATETEMTSWPVAQCLGVEWMMSKKI